MQFELCKTYLTLYHKLTRKQFWKWLGISSWCFGTAIVGVNFQVEQSRCSQVAVFSLNSPNRVDTRQGWKAKIWRKETLVEHRFLGFTWEDISRMLLISRWTIHRRVSEFGLTHQSRFSDITDEQLDCKVIAFLNEHGCLVGTSMVLGHLRSEGLNIQRERVRKCLARVDTS